MTRSRRRPTGCRHRGIRSALFTSAITILALPGGSPGQELPPLPASAPSLMREASRWAPGEGLPPLPTAATPAPDPVEAEGELSRGVLEFEGGRYETSLSRLRRADAAGPGAAYYRGLSLLALDRAREALGEFEAVGGHPGAPAELKLDFGVGQLLAGDPEDATKTLERYRAEHPNDPYGHYFLGVSLFRQKRYADAALAFEGAATDAKLAPYLDFYRGLSAYEQGDTNFRAPLTRFGARGGGGAPRDLAFRLAQASPLPGYVPGSSLVGGGPARFVGNRPVTPNGIEGPAVDRRWNLAVLSGYEYDTNVALAPAITPIGLGGLGNRDDSRWLVASFGEYRLVQRDRWVLGLIGSTYDSFQFQRDQFNVQDYMGGTYSNVALGDSAILGMRYEYHATLLDGAQFSNDHRLTPNFTLREGDFGHLTTFYEFEDVDIFGFALVPAQIRSSAINSVGVTQAFYLMEGAGRLYVGYRFDAADAVGSDFDRHTNQVNARLELPLPWKMVGNVGVRQFWDDYKNPNSLDFFGRPRNDRRTEVNLGLQKFLTPHVSTRADYTYSCNDSNVENLFGSSFYSYDRHVVGLLFIYDF